MSRLEIINIVAREEAFGLARRKTIDIRMEGVCALMDCRGGR